MLSTAFWFTDNPPKASANRKKSNRPTLPSPLKSPARPADTREAVMVATECTEMTSSSPSTRFHTTRLITRSVLSVKPGRTSRVSREPSPEFVTPPVPRQPWATVVRRQVGC